MRKHKKLRSGAPTKRKPPSTRKEQQEEHATASAHHPVRELPGEVLKLIKDRTVDISAASKYWRKAWARVHGGDNEGSLPLLEKRYRDRKCGSAKWVPHLTRRLHTRILEPGWTLRGLLADLRS